jgi:hypothetical protein
MTPLTNQPTLTRDGGGHQRVSHAIKSTDRWRADIERPMSEGYRRDDEPRQEKKRHGGHGLWRRGKVAETRFLVLLVGGAYLIRLAAFGVHPGMLHPDEIFQYAQQGYRMVYGIGGVPWE